MRRIAILLSLAALLLAVPAPASGAAADQAGGPTVSQPDPLPPA